MKKVVIGILAGLIALLAIIVALSVIVPLFLPARSIAAQVAAEIEKATGYRLAYSQAALSILPLPSLELDGATLAVTDHPPFAQAVALRAGLSPLSLLGGSVNATSLSIIRPTVELRTEADGSNNYALGAFDAARLLAPWVTALPLRQLTVLNGRVSRVDVSGGRTEDYEDIGVSATLDPETSHLTFNGQIRRDGLTPVITLDIASLRDLAGKGQSDVAATVHVRDGALRLSGAIDLANRSLKGHLFASTQALPRLASSLGYLAKTPINVVSVEGEVAASPDRLTVSEASYTLNSLTAKGTVAVDMTAARPMVEAKLALDALDLSTGPLESSAPRLFDIGWLDLFDGKLDIDIGTLADSDWPVWPAITAVKARANWTADGVGLTVDQASLAGLGQFKGETRLVPGANGLSTTGKLTIDKMDMAAIAGLAPALAGQFGAEVEFAAVGEAPRDVMNSLALKGRLAMTNGTVQLPWSDGASAAPAQLRQVAASLRFDDLDSASELQGSGLIGDRPVDFHLSLPLRRVINGEELPVTAKVTAGGVTSSYTGRVNRALPTVAGALTLEAPSLAEVAGLFGWPSAGLPAGAVTLNGDIEAADGHTRFNAETLTVGTSRASGTLDVATDDDKPAISLRLQADDLDLGGLLGGVLGTDLPAGGVWPGEAIDLARYGAVNLDAVIDAKLLRLGALSGGPGQALLRLGNDHCNVKVDAVPLLGGKASGTLGVNGSGDMTAKLKLETVAAGPFLKALGGSDRLDAPLSLEADLTGRGGSLAKAIASLAGQASVTVGRGTIGHFALSDYLKGLLSEKASGLGTPGNGAEALDALTANFALTDGAAKTTDLSVATAHGAFTGSGSYDLSARSVDLRLKHAGGKPSEIVLAGNWLSPVVTSGVLAEKPLVPPGTDPLGAAISRLTADPATKDAPKEPAVAKDTPKAPAAAKDAPPVAARPPASTSAEADQAFGTPPVVVDKPAGTNEPTVSAKPETSAAPAAPPPPLPRRRPAGLGETVVTGPDAGGPMVLMPIKPARDAPAAVTGGAVEGRVLPPPCVTDAKGACVGAAP